MTIQSRPGFFLLGGGRTGASLAWYFSQKDIDVQSLVEKNPRRLQFLQKTFQWPFLQKRIQVKPLEASSLIILTVPDGLISDICHYLAGITISWKDKIVIHCSGTLPTSTLQPLSARGAHIACVHPIFSFSADPAENHYLKDCWFDIESDDEGFEILKKLLPFDNKKFIRVDAQSKLKNHVTSVFFSNFMLALAGMGEGISGGSLDKALPVRHIFLPLVQSALQQYASSGLPEAFTGPAIRGDLDTIVHHFKILREKDPETFEIYRLLTKKILSLARLPQDRQNMILDHLKNL